MAVYYTLKNADGTTFEVHGPPYTEEEEREFYRRYDAGMRSGQATVAHRPTASAVVNNKELFERLSDDAKAYWRQRLKLETEAQ